MSKMFWLRYFLLLAVATAGFDAVANAATVLFTADGEGHVNACQTCPSGHGLGGLARRATLVTQARRAGPVLLLDGGNALFGDESLTSQGKVIVAAYNALGYDAINLSSHDFLFGKDQTLALLKDAKFDVVSANVVDGSTGKPLVKPYVIRQVGNEKIAILGVTERPAAIDVLPSLRSQFAGIRIDDPSAAIARWLPEARKEAPAAVLMYYGSAAGLRPIVAKFPHEFAAFLVGGVAADELPPAAGVALVAAEKHGKSVARVALGGGAKAEQLPVSPSLAADPQMDALTARYERHVDFGSLPPAPPAASPLPARLAPDQTYPINASAANRGVRLTALSAQLAGEYATLRPADGRQFLVLSTEWENLIPLTLVKKQLLATEYKVPNLGDNLYLLVDGVRVSRLVAPDPTPPGCIAAKDFHVDQYGQKVRGNVLFEVPRQSTRSLELRLYDFAHGHAVIALQTPAQPLPQAKPFTAPQKNEVIEAAIYDFQSGPTYPGLPPRAGMRYVSFELRAQSLFSYTADATAFDPKAVKGAKLRVGTVTDWKESRKYMQAVADGVYAYAPLPQSELAEEPRFLPDVMTGGRVVFLVPEASRSLELRCDFPNAKLPDGTVRRAAGLTIPIEGRRPAPAEARPIATAKDGIFDVAVLGQQAVESFGGAKANDGQRFVVLDVRVKNLNKQQEFFQPKGQLKFATAAGEQVEYDDASYGGMHPPAEQMYIPAGEQRRFELAYRVGADETRPRVAYAAVTEGESKVLTLPALVTPVASAAEAPSAPAPAAAPPPAPEPTPAHSPAPAPMKPTAPEAIAAAPPPPPAPAADPAPPAPAADSGPAPRPHGPARGIEGVGLTAEQVNAAIDRGGKALWEYCKKQDAEDRVPFGQREQDVLCALALVHADAHKKIPECDAAIRAFLTRVDPPNVEGHHTYVEGLLCMLIEAYGDPEFEPKLRGAARWLVEAAGSDGTWTYSANVPEDLFKQAAPTGVLQVSGGMPPGARAEEWKRLTPWPKDSLGGDNSCTQYALLGLQSAAAAGIRMPSDLWSRALAEQRKRQGTKSGGWDYHDTGENGGYGSMTAAGICAVAIGSYQTGNKSFASDPAVVHGLGWMDKNFAVDRHPEGGGDGKEWLYYWLYSVERVGRMLDADFIGIHEWYPEGAAWLVHGQQPDGLWPGLYGQEKDDPRLPSSFALLFLTRATPPLKPIERHGPGMLKTAAVAPDNRFYVILDASGSMLDNMDGRMKFDIARDSVRSMIDALPPNSEVALRVYGHRKSALDPDCDEDTELKIPMGKLDKRAFNAALDTLRPRGKTPMALSIEDAIHDLGDVSADKPVTLLLLTDGGEDTRRPRGNPIKACAALAKVKNVRFHIIGFDINEPDWSQQLQEMAQVSGGRYWPAARGADLVRSVRDAVLGIPEQFTVLDANGHALKAAQFGESVPLNEGKYVLRTTYAGRPFEQSFYVSPGETTAVTFDASQVPASAPAPAPPPAPTAAAPEPTPPNLANWPKFCTHCGAPLKPGQKFCTKCGQPVVVK
jgi:hypothetical protein